MSEGGRKNMTTTPDEFKKRMREIFPESGGYDPEAAHVDADDLMCEVLEDLGYGDGLKPFKTANIWYA